MQLTIQYLLHSIRNLLTKRNKIENGTLVGSFNLIAPKTTFLKKKNDALRSIHVWCFEEYRNCETYREIVIGEKRSSSSSMHSSGFSLRVQSLHASLSPSLPTPPRKRTVVSFSISRNPFFLFSILFTTQHLMFCHFHFVLVLD